MIMSNEAFMERIRGIVGERTDDEALKFIEDSAETLANRANTDFKEEKEKIDSEWRKKLEENDNSWRKKYKDAFFNREKTEETKIEVEESSEINPKDYKFENLFTKGDNNNA